MKEEPPMKKLLAIVMTLCLMISVAAFAEESAPFVIKDGITFGMNQKDLTAAFGGARYETDVENTHGGVSFIEMELENQTVNGLQADVKYLLSDDQLAAVHVDYKEFPGIYDKVKATLAEAYGESAPVDTTLLGKGIFAVDDDGRLDDPAECWISGNVMIILEKDYDGDVDVFLVDLAAAYIK